MLSETSFSGPSSRIERIKQLLSEQIMADGSACGEKELDH